MRKIVVIIELLSTAPLWSASKFDINRFNVNTLPVSESTGIRDARAAHAIYAADPVKYETEIRKLYERAATSKNPAFRSFGEKGLKSLAQARVKREAAAQQPVPVRQQQPAQQPPVV